MQENQNIPPQFHPMTPDEINGANNSVQTANKRGK
jgi:hypothetical protein